MPFARTRQYAYSIPVGVSILEVQAHMEKLAVYILASRPNGTLYTGVTSDLVKRFWEHRGGFVGGFTKRHGVDRLVYFEFHDHIEEAIVREKRLKKWNRSWKIDLIEGTNPRWRDLWPSIVGGEDVDSRFRGNDGWRGNDG